MNRPSPPSLAAAAARYGEGGWPVFPLHEARDGACSCAAGADCRTPGKHPRTSNGFHDATTDPTRIAVWWARWPTANVGVPTGRTSGLVVVDLDGDRGTAAWKELIAEHDAMPGTAQVATPHGAHVWYRLPSGLAVPRRIGIRDGVDILGENGYAVAPPSVLPCTRASDRRHPGPCTGAYTWTQRGRIATVPAWIATLAHSRSNQDGSGVTPQRVLDAMRAGNSKTYGQAAIDGEVARVVDAPRGQRNDTLYHAARRLGRLAAGGELDPDVAADALLDASRRCGLVEQDGERQQIATIRSGLNAGLRNPRRRLPRAETDRHDIGAERVPGTRSRGSRRAL